MNKNWKSLLAALARLIGKGLRFFISRVVPATWRWLRDRAFPVVRRLYLKLPYRNPVTAVVVVAAIGLVLWWRPDTGAPGSAAFDSTAPIDVSRREARWVEQLLSDDWEAQKEATRGVLDALGAKVVPDDVLIPDGNGLFVTSPELVMLAMDGARKATVSRLTLSELAFMLQDFGFPFPENQVASTTLENGVREWVRQSLEDPGLSGASAARFLHAMAARQTPPIDLAASDWTAEQHTLTHLELFTFFAGFADGAPGVSQQVAGTRTLARPSVDLFAASFGRLLDAAIPAAYAADRSSECSPMAEYYDEMGKKLDFEQNAKTMEGAYGALMKAAEQAGAVGAGVAKAVEAINYAFKIQKLVLLYSSLDMKLTANQHFVHKPHPGEADKEVIFDVTVGLDEEKYREFVQKLNASESGKSLRDCLASLGLPTPSDMADIVKEMENWDVEWRLDGGNGIWTMFRTGHASWSREKNGFTGPNHSREKLNPIDATHVGQDFIVDIRRETRTTGDILSAIVTGQAILRTDGTLPGTEVAGSLESAWKTLMDGELIGAVSIVGTVIGGIGTTGGEVASGWARRIWDPKAFYKIAVAYHEEVIPEYTYEGTVTAVIHSVNESKQTSRIDENRYSHYNTSWQGQGTLSARVRTVRMTPYTSNEGTDIWRMEGDATMSGSIRNRRTKDAQVQCAGAMLRYRKETRNDQGSGSNSTSGTYALRLEQSGDRMRGGDYALRLVFDGASVSVPYTESWTDTGQAGCEFSSREGWNRSGSEEKVDAVSTHPSLFSHVIEIPGLYPETITGQVTVTDGPFISNDGEDSSHREQNTTWSWNLRRVDP